MSFLDWLNSGSETFPEKTAIADYQGGQQAAAQSYSEFYAEAGRLAVALSARSKGAGHNLLLVTGCQGRSLKLLLAALQAGIGVTLIDSRTPAQQIDYVAGYKPPDYIFSSSPSAPVEKLAAASGALLISNSPCPGGNNSISYTELVQQECPLIPSTVKDSTPALWLHTSGSSGTPKILHYNHGQLKRFMARHDYLYRQFSDTLQQSSFKSDLIASLSPAHFGGLCFCLQALKMHRSLHLLQGFDIEQYWQLVLARRVRLLMMVPSMFAALLTLPQALLAQSGVRYCVSIGEALGEPLAQKLGDSLHAGVYSAYGLSECETGIGHHRQCIESQSVPPASCGRHLFGQVKLLAENPRGKESYGELWVKNETVFPCYLQEDLNRLKYERGWFKTGDLFRRDKQGNYFYCGRKDDMLKINGKNIYPAQLEVIADTHPDTERSVATAFKDSLGRTRVGLAVQNKCPTAIPGAQLLIDYFISHADAAAIPSWVMVVGELPLLANGKVDRICCRKMLQEHYDRHIGKPNNKTTAQPTHEH